MTLPNVQTLLKDRELERMRGGRRSATRRPFLRPVTITYGPERNHRFASFSRDICKLGMSTVGQVELPNYSQAWLSIELICNRAVTVRARVKRTEKFGRNCFLIGWEFLEA